MVTIIALRFAPERGAAWLMGRDRWAAGAQLMASADPAAWAERQAYVTLGHDNRDNIDACRKQAEQTRKDQRCRVTVKAPEKAPSRQYEGQEKSGRPKTAAHPG